MEDQNQTRPKEMLKSSNPSPGSGRGTGGSGTRAGRAGSVASETGSLDITGNTGGPSSGGMEGWQAKNEKVLCHKTKVRKVKPPSRIVYEWEWNVPKFDKAFPLITAAGALAGSLGILKTKVLKSEKIVAGGDIGRKSDWYFILSEANGKLSWYLLLGKLHKSSSPWIHIAFTLRIVDSDGRELLLKNRCFRDFGENFRFGWDDILELEKLYQEKHTFLVGNMLRFRILLEMYVGSHESQLEAMKQEKDEFAKIMTTDMWKLRTATGTADVHLECGGKVFPVHKLILSARSAAFSKLFDAPGTPPKHFHGKSPGYTQGNPGGDNPPEKEQTVSSVSVPDVEPNILEIILDYVYSGNVKPLGNPQLLSGVVRAADKFELNDLKSYCFNALMNFVSEENIGNMAVLAYRHNAEKNVRLNINGYCIRNMVNLMTKKSFQAAFKLEPDAFFPDDENTSS